MNFIWVFLGGGFGSVTRYCIGLLFQKTNLLLPLATLASNLTASLIFALALTFNQTQNTSATSFKLLVLTGFCGGLSTFSTFSFETWTLLKQSSYGWAITNVIISLALCTGAFILVKNK